MKTTRKVTRRIAGYGTLAGLAGFVAAWRVSPAVAERLQLPVGAPPPPPAAPAGPRAGQAAPKADIPQLTDEERARAVSVATASSTVAQVLSGKGFTVSSVGVWHTRSLRKIGAGVIYSLAEPATVGIDWPYVKYDQSEASFPPYEVGTVRYKASNVKRLVVMVDLHRNAVVQIGPGPEAKLETRPTLLALIHLLHRGGG
jgi:hypothetical protein